MKTYEQLQAENEMLKRRLESKFIPGYSHPLLDHVREQYGIKNDAALARAIKVEAPQISKIRRRQMAVSAGVMVKLHETFGISFPEMRELLKGVKVSV